MSRKFFTANTRNFHLGTNTHTTYGYKNIFPPFGSQHQYSVDCLDDADVLMLIYDTEWQHKHFAPLPVTVSVLPHTVFSSLCPVGASFVWSAEKSGYVTTNTVPLVVRWDTQSVFSFSLVFGSSPVDYAFTNTVLRLPVNARP